MGQANEETEGSVTCLKPQSYLEKAESTHQVLPQVLQCHATRLLLWKVPGASCATRAPLHRCPGSSLAFKARPRNKRDSFQIPSVDAESPWQPPSTQTCPLTHGNGGQVVELPCMAIAPHAGGLDSELGYQGAGFCRRFRP